MKNFGFFLIGLVIGAALVYMYNSNNMIEEVAQTNPPKGLITPKEAKALDKAFDLKHNIINDSLFKKSPNGGDNRSSWYAIEDIESYLAHAKKQANELGFNLDGIRVYLGSYPDEKDQSGLTTMFFIPTGQPNVDKGAIFSFWQGGSPDIPGGDGLNKGSNGIPPGANYPQ